MPPASTGCQTFDLQQDTWSVRRILLRLWDGQQEAPPSSTDSPHSQIVHDRRSCRRRSLQKAALLRPVLFDGTEIYLPEGAPPKILVITTDISPKGLGLTHDEPLPFRHGVISFDSLCSFLLEERWEKPAEGQIGYRSGWKILGVVHPGTLV